MYAEQFYNDIKEICKTTDVRRSDKQRKENIYRAVKARAAYYKDLAEKQRKENSWGRRYEVPSDDEIKIHVLSKLVSKSEFSEHMSSQEYVSFILTSIKSVMGDNV